MSIADDLETLDRMHAEGTLSDEDHARAKERLLSLPAASQTAVGQWIDSVASEPSSLAMLLHLSQFCGYVVPLAGFIVPILIWQWRKDQDPIIDQHGRMVANWILSQILYSVIATLLAIVLVGFVLLLALIVMSIAFPILGGIKANRGEIWRYPFTINFIKGNEPPEPLPWEVG